MEDKISYIKRPYMDQAELKRYCFQRLEEIRAINMAFRCPSSFVCIAAFIGYLSRLAYGRNIKGDTGSYRDSRMFKDFITNCMPDKYHSIAEIMYGTFRCGIVHSMSFDDELEVTPQDNNTASDRDRFIANPDNASDKREWAELVITHSFTAKEYCRQELKRIDLGSQQVYILEASVLCDDIEWAINKMFSDQTLATRAVNFSKCQRPIRAIAVGHPGSGSDNNETALKQAQQCDDMYAGRQPQFNMEYLNLYNNTYAYEAPLSAG